MKGTQQAPSIFAAEIPLEVNDCNLDSKLLAKPDGDGRTVAHLAAFRGDQDVSLLRRFNTCGWNKNMVKKCMELTPGLLACTEINWFPNSSNHILIIKFG